MGRSPHRGKRWNVREDSMLEYMQSPGDGFWLLAVDRRSKTSWIMGLTRPLLPSFSFQLFAGSSSDSPESPLSSQNPSCLSMAQ